MLSKLKGESRKLSYLKGETRKPKLNQIREEPTIMHLDSVSLGSRLLTGGNIFS